MKQTKQKWRSGEIPLPHLPHRLHSHPGSTEIQVLQQGKTPIDVARETIGYTPVVCLVSALVLAAAAGLSIVLTPEMAQLSRPPIAARPPSVSFDPSRFILNALLVPALDADAVPLRWVDPRPAMQCGPDTTVRVNHKRLRAGALVPDAPFELEWQTDGCRPFGAHGPRFDGRVRLTVFREDWGFSALVEPSNLRVASTEPETIVIERGAASTPQFVDGDESVELTFLGVDRSIQ